MRVFRKFRSSDGRIKIATLSGVSVMVAVIAMLVGVLPVFASHTNNDDADHPLVEAVQVDWGGGSGACDDDLISLEDDEARGPSAARWEAHLNNPRPGEQTITGNDPDGTEITITVDENDEFFEFSVESGMAAYDVVANGGKKSNHYDYDNGDSGVVRSDEGLSAPQKGSGGQVHKLSHINICYDVQLVTFDCDGGTEDALLFGEDGIFAGAKGQIFTNSNPDLACDGKKQGLFFINNQAEETTLDFGEEGGVVAGRAVFTKVFLDENGDPDPGSFEPLEYDPSGDGFVDIQWCTVDPKHSDDGDQFNEELEDDEYPSLEGVTDTLTDEWGDEVTAQSTACKVSEEENAAGVQQTVVYFEFEDPQFR
ncbi:MAG: hypothetical protein ACLFWH_12655 [Actinomycetota bacterium]